MRVIRDESSMGRSGMRTLAVLICLVVMVALLPASLVAAQGGQARNYVVTLAVPNAEKSFVPGNRVARQRIELRAERTASVTDRLASQHGFRARHRFERTAPGFSARLTPQQARDIAADDKVVSVRPARRFKPANQVTPRGVKRVKAAPDSLPGGNVDVDIAILDTGIGPVGGNELNVRGGINCADNPAAPGYDPDDWEDSISSRHGTHVAGTAAARDNDTGVVGVAPGARLWSVRVFDGPFGDEATIVCGLQWAISTHDGPDAPPDTQPIEVINMSLQGPRGTVVEACPGAPGDIIHQAICEAVDVGITVVVAAGNNGSNTRKISPAGYDQVITVGALSDFDGQGGGAAQSDCGLYKDEKDDSYARFSNYGSDVDIVAPGTCVESTTTAKPGQVSDGSHTKLLTGTSMAAPHVTGAVARYLADHPNTSPEKMGRLVRAAGRMDWNPKSDPHWSGIGDADEPNRVLDVKALIGNDDVRVWLYRDAFSVGGKDTKRATRIDVQREGGYDGQVSLAVTGLPGAVGSSSFDASTLAGLTGLGTNVRLTLKTKAPDGLYDLAVEADGSGGNPSGSRALGLKIDRTGPRVQDLAAKARANRARLGDNGSVQSFITWSASDALSPVSRVVLQRRVGTAPWKSLGVQKGSSSKVVLKPRRRDRFRIIATDSLGNRKTSAALPVRLSIRDSKSSLLQRPASGGWKDKPVRKAFGGSLLLANKPTDGIATSFRGKAFAVVGPVGPGRGTLRLRVDGGPWREVSLRATKGAHQRVVFSRRLEDGVHHLEIEGFKGQTAIDALLLVR